MDKKKNSTFSQAPDDFSEATGTTSDVTQQMLLRQAMNLSTEGIGGSAEGIEPDFEMARALMEGFAPKDAAEGMMAAEIVSVHNKAMRFMHEAEFASPGSDDENYKLTHAMKLMSLSARLIQSLKAHRSKGEQKITVERVNVQSGGQAIVGNVSTGDGRSEQTSSPAAIEDMTGDDVFMPDMKPAKQRSKAPAGKDE